MSVRAHAKACLLSESFVPRTLVLHAGWFAQVGSGAATLAAGIDQVQDLRGEGVLRNHWEMRGCP